jgi:hypothetical protein
MEFHTGLLPTPQWGGGATGRRNEVQVFGTGSKEQGVGLLYTLACIVPRTSSTSGTCDVNQDGAFVSFRSVVGSAYYVEVSSFSLESGFNQDFAGTTGFVGIRIEG